MHFDKEGKPTPCPRRMSTMIGRRRTRPSATAMAACLALAFSLVATAESFVLPTRAMSQAQTGFMSSSISSSLTEDPAAATFPWRSLSRRGGRVREIVGGIRGGKSTPAGALSASSVDAVGAEVREVLGENEGVLSEEQRAMAATLVQLGQVGGIGRGWRESERCPLVVVLHGSMFYLSLVASLLFLSRMKSI